jgi:hypothetical protein
VKHPESLSFVEAASVWMMLVFVERVGWNRTDCVTYSDVGNILPHGIDNPGRIIF